MKQLYRSFKLQEYICNRCKSDATAANEKQTVLNQQVAVIEHLCSFYMNVFLAKAQVSAGGHPQKGKTREKNYRWKSAFFLQYPSMFGKVQWRFRGAMIGSHMLINLSEKGRKTVAEDILQLVH